MQKERLASAVGTLTDDMDKRKTRLAIHGGAICD